jgi:murein DD-endopeptidase MepM/ murein hydrolase activator NlpD
MKPILCDLLFPQLKDAAWGRIDINALAEEVVQLLPDSLDCSPEGANPFLNPVLCEKWLNLVHKIKEVDYSWGGYLEDRSQVWSGHYHKRGEVIHLGVDFYVPVGVEVYMPIDGDLCWSQQDPDQNGGWGGKLIFRTQAGYLVFGHLKEISDSFPRFVKKGEVIGKIAEADKNGGWSPHLHVQLMKEFKPEVDGYGPKYDGMELDFLNPISTLVGMQFRSDIASVV